MKTLMLRPGTVKGRTALVTGGGTGLGKGMALALSQLGAAVAIMGRYEVLFTLVTVAVTFRVKSLFTSQEATCCRLNSTRDSEGNWKSGCTNLDRCTERRGST